MLAHLKQGSARVAVGQRVKRGQPIAQVGNSGSSSEPHLHVQVQNGPNSALSPSRDCGLIRCYCAMPCSFAAASGPRPFRQTLAATIASAGSAADQPSRPRSGMSASRPWVSPLNQPGVLTSLASLGHLTCLDRALRARQLGPGHAAPV